MWERHTWFLTEGLPLLNATLSSVELFSMPLSGPEAVVSPLRSSSTEHSHSFTLRLCSAVRAPSLCSSRSNLWYVSNWEIWRKERLMLLNPTFMKIKQNTHLILRITLHWMKPDTDDAAYSFTPTNSIVYQRVRHAFVSAPQANKPVEKQNISPSMTSFSTIL